jgi:hypothetical protein
MHAWARTVEWQRAAVCTLVLGHAAVSLIAPVWVRAVHVEQALVRDRYLGHLQPIVTSVVYALHVTLVGSTCPALVFSMLSANTRIILAKKVLISIMFRHCLNLCLN